MKLFRNTNGSGPAGRNSRSSVLLGMLLGLACGLGVGTTQALDIQLFDVGSPPMTAEQLAAFEAAAQIWENKIGTPVTVKVNVGFDNLDPGVLGSTMPLMCTHSYSNVRNALALKAESYIEDDIIAKLPAASLPVTDVKGPRQATKITMSRANARALGVGTGIDPLWGGALPNDADGEILFANAFASSFDYNPNPGVPGNKQDFVTVAAHEIGHLLGFISLTDVQDLNANFTLWPLPLDLYRFPQTGGSHDLTLESRLITHGPAEYSDTSLNNIPFSQGVLHNDPSCGCCAGGCQASHWQDNLHHQLMDPTLGLGEGKPIHAHDAHAMDNIGWLYPSPFINPDIIRRFVAYDPFWKWKNPWCLTCPPFDFPEGFPRPHEIEQPPFEPNVGMVIALEMNVPGCGVLKRTASGVALFQDARRNASPVLNGLRPAEGQVHLFPQPKRPEILPPAFMDMYFESDFEGVPFSARATFSEAGAEFEPSLGRFGGYHLTLALDGMGDGEVGDVDGIMTIQLLADELLVPDTRKENVFTIDPNIIDNSLEVLDALAFGLCDAGTPKAEVEPNNLFGNAQNLGLVGFSAAIGSIKPAGDVDYYRFTAPSNSKAWITVDTGGPQFAGANSRDSVLRLFSAGGVLIETDHDDGSGNGANSSLESGDASAIAGRTLAQGGTYYASVSGAAATHVLSPYRLYVTVTTGPIPHEVEANNTAATATPLVAAGFQVGVRSARILPGDVDYYRVVVPGPSILHVGGDGDPDRSNTPVDITVDLIAPDGVTQLFHANSSALAAFPAEGFPFRLHNAGAYFVRVRGVGATGGDYHIMTALCRTTTSTGATSPAGVPLGIRHRRETVHVFWPADHGEAQLQLSRDLREWSDVALEPDLAGENISVDVPASAPHLFFRLKSE